MAVMDANRKKRVLLVEDDRQLGPLIAELIGDDFDVTLARDGRQGLHLGLTREWEALVVDRGLPLLDGASLVSALRDKGVTAPVLILTALGTVQDKVDGLDAGANDYLVKPFDAAELAARLRALTRTFQPAQKTLPLGDWTYDAAARLLLSPYGERVSLSPREGSLLEVLAAEPERVFSRAELLGKVFSAADQPGAVDTYVHYLRRKAGRDIIRTVHGAGYQLGDPS
jgi:two-component system response regulator QseB